MGESLKSVGAITMFVEDRALVQGVLRAGLRRTPSSMRTTSRSRFKFENMILNLLETPAPPPELIEPAPVATAESGSRFQLTGPGSTTRTPSARNWDPAASKLVNGPINRDWGVRTAAFADPDGHIWEVAGKIPG